MRCFVCGEELDYTSCTMFVHLGFPYFLCNKHLCCPEYAKIIPVYQTGVSTADLDMRDKNCG
jgi:hypothetical protein